MNTLEKMELKESLKIKKALLAVGYNAGPPRGWYTTGAIEIHARRINPGEEEKIMATIIAEEARLEQEDGDHSQPQQHGHDQNT